MKITYFLNPNDDNFDHYLNMMVDMSKMFNRTRIGSYSLISEEVAEITIEAISGTSEEQILMLWKIMKGLLLVNVTPIEIEKEIISYGISILPKIREQKEIWDEKVLNAGDDYPKSQIEFDNRKYLTYKKLEDLIYYFSKDIV